MLHDKKWFHIISWFIWEYFIDKKFWPPPPQNIFPLPWSNIVQYVQNQRENSQFTYHKTMFREQYKIKNVKKSLSKKGKTLETHWYIPFDTGLYRSAGLQSYNSNQTQLPVAF